VTTFDAYLAALSLERRAWGAYAQVRLGPGPDSPAARRAYRAARDAQANRNAARRRWLAGIPARQPA
jgi:hypothetical protein